MGYFSNRKIVFEIYFQTPTSLSPHINILKNFFHTRKTKSHNPFFSFWERKDREHLHTTKKNFNLFFEPGGKTRSVHPGAACKDTAER